MSYLRTAILLAGLTALFMLIGYLIGGPNGAVIAFFVAAATNFITYWNADKLVQNVPELIDTSHLPQVDVDHQHAMRPDPGAVAVQYPGYHGVLRFEHGTNRR